MARVLLGMSGGVDSAVAASYLKRDAHDVVGVTFLFDDQPASRIGAETAAGICQKLEIEHRVVDARQRYEEAMAQRLVEQVERGLEPSPASWFAAKVLIPALFEIADAERIRFVATGHYADVVSETFGPDAYPLRLMRGFDKANDQSFLLYQMSQDMLNRLKLPLAQSQEMEVRVSAMRQGLMMPQVKGEDNLFLYGGGRSFAEWLQQRGVAFEPGDMVELSTNSVVGTHAGLHNHNLGARVHVEIQPDVAESSEGETTLQVDELADDGIRYVVAKDFKFNKLYVGSASQAGAESCVVKDVFWTSIHPLQEKRSCRVRLHRSDSPRPVQLVPMADGRVVMSFTMPVAGLASGKTVVFYSDNMVLGGGVIA